MSCFSVPVQLIDLYFFGAVAHICAILMFVYFVYVNYQGATQQAYISLTTQGGDCQTVPIAITGEYLADYNGNWAGTPQYQESLALYSIDFNNFQISSVSQYEDMMYAFYSDLAMVGNMARKNNLATNLLYWMTYNQYYDIQQPSVSNFSSVGYGQLQSLQLTGNPSFVFNLFHNYQRIASEMGPCTLGSYTLYDQANHCFTSYYDNYTEFTLDTKCIAAVEPLKFGYFPTTDLNIFSIQLHAESFVVALGVNFGIVPFKTLRVVSKTLANFTYSDVVYNIGEYFDVRYSSMQSLFCINNITAIPEGEKGLTQLCVLTIGTTFVLPVFNPYGQDIAKPDYCTCNSKVGYTPACSEFNFLMGYVFYRTGVDIDQISIEQIAVQIKTNTSSVLQKFGLFNLLETLLSFPNYQDFNIAAYNASFLTAVPEYACDVNCLSEAFSFCKVNNNTCSMVAWNSADAMSNTVSPYKYQLVNGSCSDSMVIPADNW
jgi:hypothetical protein